MSARSGLATQSTSGETSEMRFVFKPLHVLFIQQSFESKPWRQPMIGLVITGAHEHSLKGNHASPVTCQSKLDIVQGLFVTDVYLQCRPKQRSRLLWKR